MLPDSLVSEQRQDVPLPDFRNLGIWLRVLVLVNGAAAFGALVMADDFSSWARIFVEVAWRVSPTAIFSMMLLSLVNPAIHRIPGDWGRYLVATCVAILSVCLEGVWRQLWISDVGNVAGLVRIALISWLSAWLVTVYFSMRYQLMRPAVEAAQVAALTARIRPHFLFNSLNAVLSLIRKEPQRAEAALEALSDIFRVLMRDPRDRVPLSDEIALCRQYLDLERLRLGPRLRVEWTIEDVPADASVPPLMLQPLLENAVYHGIEPSDDGGLLRIGFKRHLTYIRIDIVNSLPGAGLIKQHTAVNQMALDNIRKRLALYYDLEAQLEAGVVGQEYRVSILLPIRRV